MIGGAVRSSRKAAQAGKPLREEFFYALYTFTNIRNFAVALHKAFPRGGAAAVARRPEAGPGRGARRPAAAATRAAS